MFDILVTIAKDKTANSEYLIQLINSIRPSGLYKERKIIVTVDSLLTTLEQDDFLREGLKNYLGKVFHQRKFSNAITEIGMIRNQNFFSELKKRIGEKMLPSQPPEDSLSYLLNNTFYKSDDYVWVNEITYSQWSRFFNLMEFTPLAELENKHFAVQEVISAIEVLSLRTSGLGLEDNLLKMVPEYKKLDSPFITLAKESAILSDNLKKTETSRTSDSIDIKQLFIIINQCEVYLEKAMKNRNIMGITFDTTVTIARIKQKLDRLKLALNFLSIDTKRKKNEETISFIKQIVEVTSKRNDIGEFLNYSTSLVAYQITQHTGKTGEHYITSTNEEYKKMLCSALGGGFIIGFLSLFKVLFYYQDTSPLGKAFLYSMNYSLGFIAIYLLGFTVATKQPAMTAVTLAKTLGNIDIDHSYLSFSKLFKRLFRSQFIAFVGNVFMAFPVALALGLLWIQIFGENIIKPSKADSLLLDLNPFLSLALFHAAIAGFYLFLSGLISGYYINNNIHLKTSYRIRKHPILKNIIPEKWLQKFADFYDKKIGGIAGNFWFGIMLGSTGILGYFIGLPIDIRHIAFAAGNFALAIIGFEFNISFYNVFITILAIGLIGFFNFIVSFTLSLMLAMRSGKIPFVNIKFMLIAVWETFKDDPKGFFVPPLYDEDEENGKTLMPNV